MPEFQASKQAHYQPERGADVLVNDDLIARFIEHVHITPDKIAIMTSECSVTYYQLYLDVTYWKTQLLQMQGQVLIICLERSPLLLTLLLAMQWLGIPYIPVDPSTPIERMRAIIEDSQTQAVLYAASKHPDFSDLHCALLDVEQMASSAMPDYCDEPYLAKQTGIAYIIYTSGSTGKPKGVVISRQAMHNFLASMSTYFLQEEHAIALAITTVSFDISVLELYLPIWQQKTVFIANQMQHNNPISIVETLIHYPITFLQATPSFWSMILHLEWQSPPNLVALCGGEPLTPILAQRLLAKVTTLWNLYGPTEATVWCALKQILPNAPITIGRPIQNMEMRVMDSEQRTLPPYTKGELFIGGMGLAEGYINNPELSCNKFIRNQNALAGRLYQTGDLACTTIEGEFIIFGRTDNQIKLHGYRIELEEIEAQMQTFPMIQESAATVYNEQLVVYLSLTPNASFVESDFMQYLAKYLPGYMLPKRIVLLRTLPKTLSGKIDKKSLPVPVVMTSHIPTEQLTSMQLSLSQIWMEELAVDTLSIHDNFFSLGGHSLRAARIIASIAQQLGKKTHLNDFYQAPTIAEFAKIIEQAPLIEYNETVMTAHTGTLPLHDFQFMHWIGRLFEPQLKVINVVTRKRWQGRLNSAALSSAVQLVLRKQAAFSYRIHRFYPLQTPCNKLSLQWAEISLVDMSVDAAESYLVQASHKLFHHKTWRATEPLLSMDVYHLKNDQIEFQICMSHLIADERSLTIFFQDLSNAYLYFMQIATLSTHHSGQCYSSYVAQRHETMQQHTYEDDIFWTNYLQNTDFFYFPKQFITQGKTPAPVEIPLPQSFITNLRQFCSRHKVGINDTLCAALSLALMESCDNDMDCVPQEFCISMNKSTRDKPLYDHAIGCFLSMDTIKLTLSPRASLSDLAKQAQASSSETSKHQRAASLVKIGAMNQATTRKKNLVKFFIGLGLHLLAKGFPKLMLNKTLIKIFKNMAVADRKQQFFINLNVLNQFADYKNTQQQAVYFNLPQQPIPPHPNLTQVIDYMLELTFHRDDVQQPPCLVIAANLTPEFQKRLGETLISFVEHAVDKDFGLNGRSNYVLGKELTSPNT